MTIISNLTAFRKYSMVPNAEFYSDQRTLTVRSFLTLYFVMFYQLFIDVDMSQVM